ncbi:hypothetical protein C7B61_07455 [filamentous cyanobacterium CCP1]|nr:hypothetical protein C7B76_12165 [filamentous cyanobacterium CCP2]PSB67192.1 hypothetical protein C7B61_07455 [filamentous cyanobacterium CCP1]
MNLNTNLPTDTLSSSWDEGTTKAAILDFVRRVTTESSPDYAPPSERIATFDNDGTLWCKQPNFVQGFFLLDRIKTIAAEQPDLGNSDGDLAMLQYTAAGAGARLALLLHHDDAEREYAYDRDFHLSPLREALEEVPKLNGGHIVSMKQDFKQVFP